MADNTFFVHAFVDFPEIEDLLAGVKTINN